MCQIDKDIPMYQMFDRSCLKLQKIRVNNLQKILRWRQTGFHGQILSLKRLSIDIAEGKACYQYGKHSSESEQMDYLEFIARVTSPIPDKRQFMIRYYRLSQKDEKKIRKAFNPSDLSEISVTYI